MHRGGGKPDNFQSPATPAIVRLKRSAEDQQSPPTSVRSNLFQSIFDGAETKDMYSSPLRTTMTHEAPHSSSHTLDSKMLLLSSEINSFGYFVEEFSIVGVIGVGSFSEVCKVDSRRKPGHGFALKRCNKLFQSESDRERMLLEARTLKTLNENSSYSRYIPKFYAAWQENSFLYMLVEYAEFGSVQDVIQKHGNKRLRIPDSFLWWVIHDACQGLRVIHGQDFVHLDIKPANLLIFSDRTIKLSDFGVATRSGPSRDEKEGDFRYMAKELMNDNSRKPSADIFSLGITLYEIASIHTMRSAQELDGILGKPLSLPTEGEGWHQLRDGAAPTLLDRPHSLSSLVVGMLMPAPEARPTAEQLIQFPDVVHASYECSEVLIEAIMPRPIINRSSSFDPRMLD